MRFEGKVVLITGASSGIGAAAARLFAEEGANVVVVSNQNELDVVADECANLGPAPHTVKADLTKDVEVKRIVKETIDKYGKLDILLNNAGILRFGGVLDGKVMETFDEVININFRAAVYLTSLAVPHLVRSKGNIVNISSTNSSSVLLNTIAYSASKAAMTNFTRGIALELAPYGVRVNAISPGAVATNILKNAGIDASREEWKVFTALKRLSDPGEVADLVAYLASDAAKGITGSDYVIDNGSKLLH